MYFKTAICDDNITEINILTNYLKQYEIEYDIEFKTDLYSSADALIEKYISVGMYDLLFLDVEMPGLNGIYVGNELKQTHPKLYDYCINKLGMGEVLDYINVKY